MLIDPKFFLRYEKVNDFALYGQCKIVRSQEPKGDVTYKSIPVTVHL